jgi:hypothetical protein
MEKELIIQKYMEGFSFRAILRPTINDFQDLEVLNLIDKEVIIYPNFDQEDIDYGKYKGQKRWYIQGHEGLAWFPTEDFEILEVIAKTEVKKDEKWIIQNARKIWKAQTGSDEIVDTAITLGGVVKSLKNLADKIKS